MKTGQSEFAACVGLDWADRKHDLCLEVTATGKRSAPCSNTPRRPFTPGLSSCANASTGRRWPCAWSSPKAPSSPRSWNTTSFVVFLVQPAMLAKYRNAFTPSRAKDDPTDAEFALELMLRYPERVQRLKPESPTMRMLRQLVETRRGVVEDRVRVTNRIVANLKAYFPQVLGLFREKDTGVFADFLEWWPTLEAAKKARRSALESFFREHNVRYQSTID
ncbi:MAG: transposase [Polyangiaceae bacterium]